MTELSFRQDGDPAAPALIMGSSIGTTHHIWDPQVPALARRWRVIRFNARGHGGSPAPAGPYSIADLASDVIELADHLGVERFAYCGLAMGGAIGQQLALDHRDRVRRLVLCCTAAWMGGPEPWLDRAKRVRAAGTDWLVEASRHRWFRTGADIPTGGRRALEAQRDVDPEGYAACCEALADHDLRERIGSIAAPTAVIAGADDVTVPAPMTDLLAERIPGASLTVIPAAAHIVSLEQPDAVLSAITAHLSPPAVQH